LGFVDQIPAFLTKKNNPSIIARDTTPDYIRNLNMRKYKIPAVNKKTQYEFFAESLRNAMMPVGVSQSWFNPITSGNLSNAVFFNPLTTSAPSLLGGNPFGVGSFGAITPGLPTRGTSFGAMDRQSHLKNASSTQFQSLLATIKNAFSDVGLQLHPDDLAKIQAVINKMEQYETDLARTYSFLITIVKLARLYGVSLENVDREHPTTINLSELSSVDDAARFIRGYVRDLSKNMLTNMTVQQAAAYELVNKVVPRVIDECTDKDKGKTEGTGRNYVPLWGSPKKD